MLASGGSGWYLYNVADGSSPKEVNQIYFIPNFISQKSESLVVFCFASGEGEACYRLIDQLQKWSTDLKFFNSLLESIGVLLFYTFKSFIFRGMGTIYNIEK